ncbi:MAG: hypothetical protein HY973_00740 [Candidatus Kerfeldbacteria bacterium]|nr:hypothetical protein [Candidatus Kerfeldbacteria bacterium]
MLLTPNQRRGSSTFITASVLFILIFTLAVSTRTAFAEVNDYGLMDTAKMAGIPVGETSPVRIAATVINVILGLVGVLAVVLIIYAGFAWMTAAGNEEKIKSAKKVLTGAVIGLLIIMASFIISSFIVRNVMEATKATKAPAVTPNYSAGSRTQGQDCYKHADCATGLQCHGFSEVAPGQCQP